MLTTAHGNDHGALSPKSWAGGELGCVTSLPEPASSSVERGHGAPAPLGQDHRRALYWEGEGYCYKQRLCDLPISEGERTWGKELSQSPPREDGVPCVGHETPARWLCEVGSRSPIPWERKRWLRRARGLVEATQLVSGRARSSSLPPAPMGRAKRTGDKKCCSGVCPALPAPQEAGPCAEGGREPLMVSELAEVVQAESSGP